MNGFSYLATSLTHVRLFTRVHPCVDGQGGSLNELFTTSWIVADVRSYTTVYTFWKLISRTCSEYGGLCSLFTNHVLRDHFFAQILCRTSCMGRPFEPSCPQVVVFLLLGSPASCYHHKHSVVGSLGALVGNFACQWEMGSAFRDSCHSCY